jgi:hypothetical protein
MTHLSTTAAKRRLRGYLWKLERFNRDLKDLMQAIPAPTQEEIGALLRREAPMTLEAWLVGALRQSLFHLAEAQETLSVAVTKTKRELRKGKESFSLDLIRFLRKEVEDRQRPAGTDESAEGNEVP